MFDSNKQYFNNVVFFSNVIIFRSVVSSIETRLTKTTKLKNVVTEKKMDEKQRRMKRRIEVEREEKGGNKGFGEKDTRVFFREWQQNSSSVGGGV